MNASYVYALQIVNAHMKRALGAVTPWDTFKRMTEAAEDPVDFLHKDHTYENGGKDPEHHPAPVQYAEAHHTNGAQPGHSDVNLPTNKLAQH